jgi:hypothetical protein
MTGMLLPSAHMRPLDRSGLPQVYATKHSSSALSEVGIEIWRRDATVQCMSNSQGRFSAWPRSALGWWWPHHPGMSCFMTFEGVPPVLHCSSSSRYYSSSRAQSVLLALERPVSLMSFAYWGHPRPKVNARILCLGRSGAMCIDGMERQLWLSSAPG